LLYLARIFAERFLPSARRRLSRTMSLFDAAREEGASHDNVPALSNAQSFLQTAAVDLQAGVHTIVEELVAAVKAARTDLEEADRRAQSARAAAIRYKAESRSAERIWKLRKAKWDDERRSHERLCGKYERLLQMVRSEAASRRDKRQVAGTAAPPLAATKPLVKMAPAATPTVQQVAAPPQVKTEPLVAVSPAATPTVQLPQRSSRKQVAAQPPAVTEPLATVAPETTPTVQPQRSLRKREASPVAADRAREKKSAPAPLAPATEDEATEELDLPQPMQRDPETPPPKAMARAAPAHAATSLLKPGGAKRASQPTARAAPPTSARVGPQLRNQVVVAPAVALIPPPALLGPGRTRPGVYQEVVRGAARARLPAYPCKECNNFFKAVGLKPDFCSDSCRHRYRHPRTATPEGFFSMEQEGF